MQCFFNKALIRIIKSGDITGSVMVVYFATNVVRFLANCGFLWELIKRCDGVHGCIITQIITKQIGKASFKIHAAKLRCTMKG